MGPFLPQRRIKAPRPRPRRRKPKKKKTIQHCIYPTIYNRPWTHRCMKLPISNCHLTCKNKRYRPCEKTEQEQAATNNFQHAAKPYLCKIYSSTVIGRDTHWISKKFHGA